MSKNFIQFIVGLLQGASWALVIIISTYLFFHTLSFGYIIAFISAFIGSFVGLFFVVFFEFVNIEIKKLSQSEQQTKLLQEILDRMKNNQ